MTMAVYRDDLIDDVFEKRVAALQAYAEDSSNPYRMRLARQKLNTLAGDVMWADAIEQRVPDEVRVALARVHGLVRQEMES